MPQINWEALYLSEGFSLELFIVLNIILHEIYGFKSIYDPWHLKSRPHMSIKACLQSINAMKPHPISEYAALPPKLNVSSIWTLFLISLVIPR